MSKKSVRSEIRLRGVRHNNLKNFDLDLPLNKLIVITGLSGSGKSSLAFDTLFAEGQRRYIETFSPYARQFFDRMDKPQVDSIEGIPPAIAIEQRNAVRTTRSTVGTMTEICDYMKMLWPHVAQLHCRKCDQVVRKESPQQVWETVSQTADHNQKPEALVTFDLPLSEKLSLQESLGLIAKQGYQRLIADGQIVRLDEIISQGGTAKARGAFLTVIQDRVQIVSGSRARFVEACEQAYHFGKGKLAIHRLAPGDSASPSASASTRVFSNRLHCATCDLEYRTPSAALFSFNHPVGACPTCRGFGRVISIDYDLALPDRSKTLAEGVVKPWQSGQSAECQRDLMRMCRHYEIPVDIPFDTLARKWQELVIQGDPKYGKDEEHEWPRAWYGVKGYFRWLESKAYKMHVRVLLSRYRAYTPCQVCNGRRFHPDSLLYRLDVTKGASPTSVDFPGTLSLAEFYQLPIRDALRLVQFLSASHKLQPNDPMGLVMDEVCSRLGYLDEAGLGYLTLDRPTRSLSGGETERVNLTTCLGTRLVNTLFVLDEPSVGLHPRDTERLVRILEQLRDTGNTVVVVEHEPTVMRAADQLIDLGPGHGATGGRLVFQGDYSQILKSDESLTGRYLSKKAQISIPTRRPVASQERTAEDSWILNDAITPLKNGDSKAPSLKLVHAAKHNLRDLTVDIPLSRFVCVTGVSGSGKTTLVREVLLPALTEKLQSRNREPSTPDSVDLDADQDTEDSNLPPRIASSTTLEGAAHLGRVLLMDQSLLGKTPRSNPAVYIGAFDDIREFFAQSELAKQRGLNASAFSFNSSQGQCERCRGAGFEKIEMQFLSDVFIRCPDCDGRRYRPHILEIMVKSSQDNGPSALIKNGDPQKRGGLKSASSQRSPKTKRSPRGLSIADLLDSTIEEAVAFLSEFPESRPAMRAVERLKLLGEVGLGYLKVGQPINTLSGGESQRLKLVWHLAEALDITSPKTSAAAARITSPSGLSVDAKQTPTLFLFDEPTTGLHFDDVRVLLKVIQRLVEAGHSVLVIEHNLEVIKCADWIIDLGPDAGDRGGEIVAQGTPEDIARSPVSHTGKALREVLPEQDLRDVVGKRALERELAR
jgi:excinuclease ABC subunit A